MHLSTLKDTLLHLLQLKMIAQTEMKRKNQLSIEVMITIKIRIYPTTSVLHTAITSIATT